MEIITINEAAELLLAALTSIAVGGLAGAPITLFLVSTLKHIPALNVVPSATIQFVVGLLLTVAMWIAQAAGVQVQFQSVLDFVTTVGPAILALLTTLSGSAALYQAAKKTNAGWLGYQRPVTAAEQFGRPAA